ncbi:helix-turn-helix domain-containing protein [Streptacidiphilus sp. P02-A3a]|uniref:helix-turn-helix domain-containing protein n=1 Tax=Streptacidiphilus sp. P02-A3a TaxID=2704468 RepID=UPI0015FB39B6|nr:helix-turn-helix domain-containing protein [Streptacidiphilus sp. P02-A3a]QMU69733.1 helix-turn-helix domain-containing protein [Streptacidiphilus sp. P02-A3a]
MYQERAALLIPRGKVWTRQSESEAAARVLPDGCMDLIWHDGDLLVAGPDTAAVLVPGRPGERYQGLRFAPGVGGAVLGVPAHELRDRRVPLAALWPQREVRVLAERVSLAADRGAALERLIVARVDRADPPDPVRDAVVSGLRHGRRVPELARLTYLSERQLRRRCLELFGYGPKTLDRVLRLQRALAPARRGVPPADVAARAGYADQAHLAREVRALAGIPLTELLACPPGSGAAPGSPPSTAAARC